MRLKSPRAAALSLRASAECSCVAQGAEPLAAALAFSSATWLSMSEMLGSMTTAIEPVWMAGNW